MYLFDSVPIPWRLLRLRERAGLHVPPWTPVMADVPVTGIAPVARLLALGDLILAREAVRDARVILGDLHHLFESVDIRTCNLEAMLTARTVRVARIGSALRATPEAISTVSGMGLDVVNVANNHALDFGHEAIQDTAELLTVHGIDFCGVREAGLGLPRLATRVVNGLIVGLLGFCDDHYAVESTDSAWQPAIGSRELVLAAARRARPVVDVLVVHLHWGYEFSLYPLLRHRDLARELIESGAHLVLGHHAHVPMGLERWQDGIIAYGLGNGSVPMTSYMQAGHPWTDRSFLLEAGIHRGGLSYARLHPFRVQPDGSLRALAGPARHQLLAGLGRMSRRLTDDAFLAAAQDARLGYETVSLLDALNEAARTGDDALVERVRTLTVHRQQMLLDLLTQMPLAAQLADRLRALAHCSADAGTTRRCFEGARQVLGSARQMLLAQYRWRDALRARIP